ncbi:MAG: hypothetical protein IJB94_01985, partial [Clostridia bacterium]|nr:hypothetical protein [Clostridia bacterium]
FSVTVDNSTDDGDGKSITLNHTLVNDMTNSWFDYVPYTVVVRRSFACGLGMIAIMNSFSPRRRNI